MDYDVHHLAMLPWLADAVPALLSLSHHRRFFYDAPRLIEHYAVLDPLYAAMAREIFRCRACTFACAAGLAQRMVTFPDSVPALKPEGAK